MHSRFFPIRVSQKTKVDKVFLQILIYKTLKTQKIKNKENLVINGENEWKKLLDTLLNTESYTEDQLQKAVTITTFCN